MIVSKCVCTCLSGIAWANPQRNGFIGSTLMLVTTFWLVGTTFTNSFRYRFKCWGSVWIVWVRLYKRMENEWMSVWSPRAHRNANVCAYLIAREEVCQRYTNFTLLSLWERGPLRVQEHFNNAYMPTLHVMHQPNLLMPPNKFHRCTAGNVQSHSCVGRWVILKLFLRFHFITPQCHLYVLLCNMRFIKESIPGSCRNNIRETGRNQRSLCFLTGVLTVIPMCPLRGKSYST